MGGYQELGVERSEEQLSMDMGFLLGLMTIFWN